ncbi:MAG: hypothetical protein QME75_03715 [Deltaproteobacteria bacterium]|nr:hypothetical protein [Deltaproteobacteria bacterium]
MAQVIDFEERKRKIKQAREAEIRKKHIPAPDFQEFVIHMLKKINDQASFAVSYILEHCISHRVVDETVIKILQEKGEPVEESRLYDLLMERLRKDLSLNEWRLLRK